MDALKEMHSFERQEPLWWADKTSLSAISTFLSKVIADFWHKQQVPNEVAKRDFLIMGSYALHESSKTLDEMVKLLAKKQHDYGHHNIGKFSYHGIWVRLHDKVARLTNLLMKPVPNFESIEDSWDDVVGYCALGVMLANGSFWRDLKDG